MVTAIILIKAEREQIATVAQKLLAIQEIAEVYSVAGEYDLVAIARVRRNEELAKLVTEDMIGLRGILSTNTLIAFRQYSRHDLERMFSLGQ